MHRTVPAPSWALTAVALTLFQPAGGNALAQADRTLLQAPAAQRYIAPHLREGRALKCGFPALAAALGEAGRGAGQSAYVSRPSYLPSTLLSASGRFLLHFTTSGAHAVDSTDADGDGVPDYVAAAAASLDSVDAGYRVLGWRDPLDDDDGIIDVYFVDFENVPEIGVAAFGFTVPLNPMPSSPPFVSPVFILLENDYLPRLIFGDHEPLESLRVTVAHEYHHAIQLAYNLRYEGAQSELDRYLWFAELSATYYEEVFYDGINDYYFYLRGFLGAPQLSLTETGGLHMYGAALWALYLADVNGPDILRTLWRRMAEDAVPALEAHIRVLADLGTTMLQHYREFSIWQLFTGARAVPGAYFEEAAAYPEVAVLDRALDPLDLSLPSLAFRYYRSEPTTSSGGVAMRLGPFTDSEWGAGVAGETAAGLLQSITSSAASASGGTRGLVVELLDWGSFGNVVHWALSGVHSQDEPLVPSAVNVEFAQSDRLTSAALQAGGFRLLQNYPNPFRPNRMPETFFAFSLGAAAEVTIEVRSLGGASLWTRRFNVTDAGLHYTADLGIGWDGRDRSGALVPSGVYLIVGRVGGKVQVRKMTVVR